MWISFYPSVHADVLKRSKTRLYWTSKLGQNLVEMYTQTDVFFNSRKDVFFNSRKDVFSNGQKDVHFTLLEDVFFTGRKDVFFTGRKDVHFTDRKDVYFVRVLNVHYTPGLAKQLLTSCAPYLSQRVEKWIKLSTVRKHLFIKIKIDIKTLQEHSCDFICIVFGDFIWRNHNV